MFAFQHRVPIDLIKSHGHWQSDAVLRYIYTYRKNSEAVASTLKHVLQTFLSTTTFLGWVILFFSF